MRSSGRPRRAAARDLSADDLARFSTADLRSIYAIEQELARRTWPTDPIVFARACGFRPDPWQARVLISRDPRMLLNCHRQSGKSTTAALLALHTAAFGAKALVLIVSPSERQSSELFRKVLDFVKAAPWLPPIAEQNVHSLRFEHGGRIVSLPSSETTIRGYSAVALLVEDEAGDVPDELYFAVRPMLAVSRGRMILMGTPKGRRGHFFEAWERPAESWARIMVKGDASPRIGADTLDAERRVLGDAYRQEYGCEFIDAATGLVYGAFDRQLNTTTKLPPLPQGAMWARCLGLDFGVVDANAVALLCWQSGPGAQDATVYVELAYRQQGYVADFGPEVAALDARYKPGRIVGDLGGLGKGLEGELRNRFSVPVHPAQKHNKLGYISLLNGALRQGQLKVLGAQCADLMEEWTSLPWAASGVGKKEAPGFANHAADAVLYAWREATAYSNRPEPAPPTREQSIRREMEAHWERVGRLNEQHKRNESSAGDEWAPYDGPDPCD